MTQLTEKKPRRVPAPSYTALRNLKNLSEIDEKAAGFDEVVLRDIAVRVNFLTDGKYHNIDELSLFQALKSGGIENYLRQTYGCGEFEVQLRGETTGGKKGIIVSPKFDILGDPTQKLVRHLTHLARIREGVFGADKPPVSQSLAYDVLSDEEKEVIAEPLPFLRPQPPMYVAKTIPAWMASRLPT